MNDWRTRLLSAYYVTTYLPRSVVSLQRCRAGSCPMAILNFHRIADDDANAWTTSTAAFMRGIRWLKAHFDLISLAEVQRRIRAGANRRPSVSITFDDGYAENCNVALPFLIEEKIPFTYFVTVRPVLEGVPFVHDVEMGNAFAANSVEQLRELVRAGIEIGAHTRTHPDLGGTLSEETLYDEIVGARNDLESAIDAPVRYFAFPFGQHRNMTPEAFRLAQQSGFDGVCSAYGGFNSPGDDAFHLQRRSVDGSLVRLKNWSLIDPFRKTAFARYEYRSPEHEPVAAAD